MLIELVVGPTSVIHRVHGRAASWRTSQFRRKTPPQERDRCLKNTGGRNKCDARSTLLSILRSGIF
ncbi:hypothetical protein X777_05979 [Ooceraea biroi]|uniref:Uncharacterized protein n=1 Tax=Ooceraea biroi TaxID=2015173 RepID=A0A026WGE5_OOCBI|nr:hypothetical protein X777_05979 [Ooceraea biroi]